MRKVSMNKSQYSKRSALSSFVPLPLCAYVPAPSATSSRSGFTILEVLVATAVMVVVVVTVANLFRDASGAWDIGTQRAELNTSARAAVEYIARALSCAVAGEIADSTGAQKRIRQLYLESTPAANVEDLSFVALSGDNGTLRGVRFRYDEQNRIIETYLDPSVDYDLNPWPAWTTAYLLISNVWSFRATVSSNESDMLAGASGYAYGYSGVNATSLPACLDLAIEVLSERDMARALRFSDGSPEQLGFVTTNSRVYTTRVCFPSRGAR